MQFVRWKCSFKSSSQFLVSNNGFGTILSFGQRSHALTLNSRWFQLHHRPMECKMSVSKTKPKTVENIAGTVVSNKRGKKKDEVVKKVSQEDIVDDKEYAEYDATLSQEQRNVLNHVIKGKNVFFTGSAGTGKSYLLQAIKRELTKRGKSVAMTASTGIAAVNIGGITLHKWAGLGIRLSTKISKEKRKNWLSTDVLVIDEISMISDKLFDHIDALAKEIRGNDKSFGGIQIVCVGDFFQLPPVSDGMEKQGFCFESKSWIESMDETIQLNEIFRQQHDPEFIRILNEIRLGKCSEKTKLLLDQCKHNKLDVSDGIYPTVLYSRNMHVDKINDEHLNKLTGKIVTFASYDKVTLPQGLESTKQRLWSLFNTLDGCLAATTIQLKLNAQVMLLRNISKTLINGSRGVVVDFVPNTETNPAAANPVTKDTDKDRAPSQLNASHPKWIAKNKVLPVVRFSNGEQLTVFPEKFTVEVTNEGIAERIQIPLKLAYAMTIHKSQGLTIDKAQMSLSDVFECGQAYVALSRLRGLKGFHLLDWNPKVIKAHPKVLEFYTTLNQKK